MQSDGPPTLTSLTLRYRNRSQPLSPPLDATGAYLFEKAVEFSRLPKSRVRVVYEHNGKRIPIGPDQILETLPTNSFLVRDLGPQFSYSGVFTIEYLGPFIIWPLFLFVLKPPSSLYLQLATVMWLFHYGKRLFETHFVHVFSHGTMPLFNLFKNSAYYWGFAVAIAWAVGKRAKVEPEVTGVGWAAVGAFFVFEGLNLYCHIALRRLRPKGSTEHRLPRGFLFDQITCPNYTVEILAWVAFGVFVGVIPGWLFPICGGAQMWVWAGKKRRALSADYPEVKKRGRLTPFRFL
jgi:very-long-chain enoyl-CoA reductase